MTTPQAEAEALLPWTEQHLQSALINLIEAAKNSVRGPERGGSENAVSGIYQQIVAAWNTRAQPKPVAPDDEALILNFESAIEVLSDPDRDEYADEIALAQAELDLNAAREALRRRIAELRATSLKYQLAFGDRDNDAHRLADRVAELEAALAACRDKTIEECLDAAVRPPTNEDDFDGRYLDGVEAAMDRIRALKTKEPTNG